MSMRRTPKGVRERRKLTEQAMTTKRTKGMARPQSFSLPMADQSSGNPTMAGPPVRTREIPVKSCPVPMVARMGVIPSLVMRIPLTMPARIPTPRERPMPMAT